MDFSWLLVIAGALVGVSVGLTGMGGGALMTPILIMIFGVDPTAAVGSDLAASLAMKPVGALVHHRAGTVRWSLMRWLLPTAVPAGFAGAFVLQQFGKGTVLQHRLQWAIGAALLLAVLGMLARALFVRSHPTASERSSGEVMSVRRLPTLVVGLIGGLIVGMTSVGSGSLIIVLLMLLHPRLRANDLVGTDLILAIPLVASATLGHVIVGDIRFALTAATLIGAVPGIYLGAKVSARAQSGVLRWILAILLLASGLALWHASTSLVLLASAALALVAVTFGTLRLAGRFGSGIGKEISAASTHPGRD
jgi:uncharacterized membrane protein YfcA